MAEFEKAYGIVKRYEGGLSNVAADRGGETYAGIARNFFPDWAGWPIVDRWKKALPKESARLGQALSSDPELQSLVSGWYKREWWDRLHLHVLPQGIANEIFEQSVNLGLVGAGKKVQLICNAFNFKHGKPLFQDLVVDGAIGPKTLDALSAILKAGLDEDALVHALNCMQGAHYLELAARKESQRLFTAGWMKRTHCEG